MAPALEEGRRRRRRGCNVTFPQDRTPDARRSACFLTVLEDALHVEAVGGARLVVSAALEVVGQLAGPAVVDHPRVRRADGIWEEQKKFFSH